MSKKLEENSEIETKIEKSDENISEEEEMEVSSSDEDLEILKKQIRKREKRKKKEEKRKARNDKKRYQISGIVAVVAGVIEVLSGFGKQHGSGTNLVLGSTFICLGYLYYTMGKKKDND